MAKERGALWHRVISGKHGVEEVGGACVVRGGYRVGVWKAINMVWDVLGRRAAFVVGNKRRLRFLLDWWFGNEPLIDVFPSFCTSYM